MDIRLTDQVYVLEKEPFTLNMNACIHNEILHARYVYDASVIHYSILLACPRPYMLREFVPNININVTKKSFFSSNLFVYCVRFQKQENEKSRHIFKCTAQHLGIFLHFLTFHQEV